MNPLSKIFGGATKELTESISKTIDALSTSDQEKLDAKQQLTETVMQHLNKAIELQQNVIVSESQGNWLQRSWRPILMLAFGFIIIYQFFFAPLLSLTMVDLPERFWNLLELGVGGYVIGRSVEKVADSVVKNVDISFIKKKNR